MLFDGKENESYIDKLRYAMDWSQNLYIVYHLILTQ